MHLIAMIEVKNKTKPTKKKKKKKNQYMPPDVFLFHLFTVNAHGRITSIAYNSQYSGAQYNCTTWHKYRDSNVI